MTPRFSPNPLFLLLSFLIAAAACKKSSSPAGDSGTQPPAVTAVGTPVGNPVNKAIDATGGSLTSPDGKLDLVIPAGALAANTTISIQPVTNEAPGGIGTAYQLLPEGTKFSKPVTITYHYSSDDIDGSLPYFLYIAFQDSTLTWKADIKQRDLDTLAKTVSITSTHFSIWTAFNDIRLSAGRDNFKESQTSFFDVKELMHASPVEGDEDLVSLPALQPAADNIVDKWSLDGQGPTTLTDGNISGSGSHVNYTAPPLIEDEKSVQVSVEVTYFVTIYSKGKQVASFDKIILFKQIKLLPDAHPFTLELQIGRSEPQQDPTSTGYLYHDHATMDIEVDGDSVYFTNIKNFAPDFTTQDGTDCAILSVYSDLIGVLDVKYGRGFVNPFNNTFNFTLYSDDGHYIKYDMQCHCQNCGVEVVGGGPVGPEGIGSNDFSILANAPQNYLSGDDTYQTKMTLTPK